MKALYNPLNKDFSYEILDDNNKPHTLFILSHEIAYFEDSEAAFMEKHLIDEIKNDREIGLISEAELNEIKKEINVEL